MESEMIGALAIIFRVTILVHLYDPKLWPGKGKHGLACIFSHPRTIKHVFWDASDLRDYDNDGNNPPIIHVLKRGDHFEALLTEPPPPFDTENLPDFLKEMVLRSSHEINKCYNFFFPSY